jgi:hypothetical protein
LLLSRPPVRIGIQKFWYKWIGINRSQRWLNAF